MASDNDIVNQGLSLVGGDLREDYTDTSDTSTEATLARLFFETARDAVLESRDWPFATDRDLLDTPSVTAPVCEYDNQFAIPSDCLRVLRISLDGTFEDQVTWVREGDNILVNAEEIYIKYIKQITDSTKFPNTFVHAVAAYLAVLFTVPLLRNDKMLKMMQTLFEGLLNISSISSSQQGPGPDTTNHSRVISAR